ncbi:MAG: GntR family transcriptional regulator [Acidobacteriota bacterium]
MKRATLAPGRRVASPSGTSHRGRGNRESLVDRAYHEIRRRILDNQYPPAHQVLEQELAAELGMSRTPIREALVRLQNEHFVHLIPRHGMRVVPLSVQDLRDVYEVLTALELTAIERLARAELDPEAMAAIEKLLNNMDLAVKKHDVEGWVKADERLHRTLFASCGNARLAAMADVLWEQGHRARTTTAHLRSSLELSNREHRAVVDAIRRHDWRDARARHTRHRARATGDIIKLLEQTRLGSF